MRQLWLGFIRWVVQYQYRLLLLGLWVIGVIFLFSNVVTTDFLTHYFNATRGFFADTQWGWLVFLALFVLRPLFLIPATIFSLLSGVFFGLYLGILIVVIGSAISATIGYWVGYAFPIATERISFTKLKTWTQLLQTHPFDTSLILHLTMLPFDIVNYFGGMLRVHFFQFQLGVIIGALPSAFTLVSIGASINVEQVLAGTINLSTINGWYLLAAVGVYAISQLLKRYIKEKRLVP